MPDVVVLGDANPDLILRGDVVPRFGQAEQLLSGAELLIGGSGSITAHALARLGRSVRLVATIGDDEFGRFMTERLRAAGVDVSGLIRVDDATGLTVVLAADGDRGMLTHLGAIPALTPERARAALETAIADGARHLHVASFFLLSALAPGLPELLRFARDAGLTTSLDTNFDPAEAWQGVAACLAEVDLLLPNRTEALALAGAGSLNEAGAALAAHGPTVVVKDGAHGAIRFDRDGGRVTAAAPVVEPVETTGAGDTFDAAYLDAFLDGRPPEECLERACIAGALATTARGGTAGQPDTARLNSALEEKRS